MGWGPPEAGPSIDPDGTHNPYKRVQQKGTPKFCKPPYSHIVMYVQTPIYLSALCLYKGVQWCTMYNDAEATDICEGPCLPQMGVSQKKGPKDAGDVSGLRGDPRGLPQEWIGTTLGDFPREIVEGHRRLRGANSND